LENNSYKNVKANQWGGRLWKFRKGTVEEKNGSITSLQVAKEEKRKKEKRFLM